MKTLKIIQSSIWKYNRADPNEVSFRFILAICDENGTLKDDKWRKCSLYYSWEEQEKDEFDYLMQEYDIQTVIETCSLYAKRVRSTEDYKANAIFFSEVFADNAEELIVAMIQRDVERLEKEREKLNNRIKALKNLELWTSWQANR